MCCMILTPPSGCCMPVAVLVRKEPDSSFPSGLTSTGGCDAQRLIAHVRAKYMPGMEHLRLPHQHRHRAASPAVYWDLIAQKSVQAAEAKCGTAVKNNEGWAIPPAAAPHPCYNLAYSRTKNLSIPLLN